MSICRIMNWLSAFVKSVAWFNKCLAVLLFLILCCRTIHAEGTLPNLALRLDGKDNNVRTGIGILRGSWTLEAWIKGDDDRWKAQEVVFGGGEYSELNIADYLPLVISNGRLSSPKANLYSEAVLDGNWHHVALSCSGGSTYLFLDGRLADSARIAFPVIPGAIGIHQSESTSFAGFLDEVRVWNAGISPLVLNEWLGKPLGPAHPQFDALVAYYNFDDGINDIAVNWVGKAEQPYHLRNGRINFRGKAPLAYAMPCENPRFVRSSGPQSVFNAVVIDNEWDSDQGSKQQQILKLRIAVNGDQKPIALNGISLDLSAMSELSDIECLQVFYTGKSPRSGIRRKLFESSVPQRHMEFSDPGQAVSMAAGANYFLVTADISPKAKPGNIIKIAVPSLVLSNKAIVPTPAQSSLEKTVTRGRKTSGNILKVLQWNIWHGGVHLPYNGLDRILDLIMVSGADLVMMQEAYGSQRQIADSLKYFLQTDSPQGNLALLSRYPISSLPSSGTMNSNPAYLHLGDKQRILVNACWLRYAYRPEYTWCYPNTGLDPREWVREDSALALKDIRLILEKDTDPHSDGTELGTILGGDFNSCSHLDWTAAAAGLHHGYGPVLFPVSRYLIEKGYLDSFRKVHPDEISRPEGTFAPIYGQLLNNRIDFIYYKGPSIRVIDSKILRTPAEIDDVWPSDHAAVLTTFEINPVK